MMQDTLSDVTHDQPRFGEYDVDPPVNKEYEGHIIKPSSNKKFDISW